MKVLFIRHGDVDWQTVDGKNISGHGRELAPLSGMGRVQIEAIANDFRLQEAEAMLCSSYARALESAALLNRHLGLDLHVEYDLHEWLAQKNPLKKLDSKTAQKARQDLMYYTGILNFPDRRMNRNPTAYHGSERRLPIAERVMPPPEKRTWESLEEVRARALSALQKYQHYRCVVVVAHAVVIACLVGLQRHINHAEIIECDIDMHTGKVLELAKMTMH